MPDRAAFQVRQNGGVTRIRQNHLQGSDSGFMNRGVHSLAESCRESVRATPSHRLLFLRSRLLYLRYPAMRNVGIGL